MASNDGSRLTVFGLTFRQHDNRHMQQILRSYGRLPSNPGNRAALYTGLFDLSKDLGDDEVQGIEDWLRSGSNPDYVPPLRPASPVATTTEGTKDRIHFDDEHEGGDEFGGELEWERYDPAEYEAKDVEMEDTHSQEGNEEIGITDPNDASSHVGSQIDNTHPKEEQPSSDVEFKPPGVQYQEPEKAENKCSVCYDGVASADLLVPSKLTSTCDHDSERRSCFPCLAEHIDYTLERFALNSIKCPFCDETLSHEEIKKYATPVTFARYEYLRFISNPDTVMCLGPSCGRVQTYTDTTEAKMICTACGFATCVRHKLPWHESQTCQEFDCDESQIERLEQAEATAKLLARDKSKICPSCKQGVTKQDGCDHLSCLCGKSWCFVCLASWENIMRVGEEAHAPTCSYHPRKQPKTKAQLAAGEAQMTESLLGAPASEALLRARDARNQRVREELRPKAFEAAEARLKAERERAKEERKRSPEPKKRKVRLLPAWEER